MIVETVPVSGQRTRNSIDFGTWTPDNTARLTARAKSLTQSLKDRDRYQEIER
jgi:hypothetical protein